MDVYYLNNYVVNVRRFHISIPFRLVAFGSMGFRFFVGDFLFISIATHFYH